MPFAEVDDAQIFYIEQGEGPPVVFLHGAAGNHVSWWQQLPHFATTHRCVAIDHRGYGRSTDPAGAMAARYVDDLERLLDALEIERAALVAQSMGGWAALGLTVRRPERVSALVLADTTGGASWPELAERQQALGAASAEAGLPLSERGIGPKFRASQPALAFLYRQIAGLNPPDAVERFRATVPDPVGREQLEGLAVPTLCIVGTDDSITPPDVIRLFQAAIPGAEYREFAGCGHSVYFEQPAAFNDAVADFLARHP